MIHISFDRIRAGRLLHSKFWKMGWMLLIFLGLSASPATAFHQAQDKIGGPVGTPGPISTLLEDQLMPRVAYASGVNEYLVAWEDDVHPPDTDIYAIRVNDQGVPIGSEIYVGTSANIDTHPVVVYSPAANEYLVVWENEYSTTDHDIIAQWVSVDGLLVGTEIRVTNSADYDQKPAVAYNPATGGFLVVFDRLVNPGEFQRWDVDAVLLDASGFPIPGVITIADSALDNQSAAVACDGLNYLVAWQGDIASPVETNIYGQMVLNDGSLIGGPIGIATWEGDQLVPRITYDSNDAQYLVVWEDHHFSPWEIYGQRLDINGNLVGNQVGVALGGSNNRTDPDVAYMPSTRSYLVVWQFEYSITDHDIYARRIAYDGSHPEAEYVITNTGFEEKLPAVASNGGSQGLVVWEDWRNYPSTGVDIYGSMETITIPSFSGVVYQGDVGDTTNPLSGVSMQLGCSSSQGYFGDLIYSTITNNLGEYQLPAYILCEYYNIQEIDPAGYFSVGAQSTTGIVYNSNWIYYTYPLPVDLSGNLFWDKLSGPGDTTPPGNWTNFIPPDWVNTQTVNASEQVEDTQSGLDCSTAVYQYSKDGGTSWSGWLAAAAIGCQDGTTNPQIISASVPFGRDSGPNSQNLVQFGVTDIAGNPGTGPQHAVKIDSVLPTNPTSISSSTHSPNVWSNNPNISIQWSGATDDRSGINGYSTSFDQSPNTIPDVYRDTADPNTVEYAYVDSSSWWFHVRTLDNAGNAASGAVHYGPFEIDTQPPTAWMVTPNETVNTPTILVSWAGGDTLSGIYSYDLQTYVNGGGWKDWWFDNPSTSATYTGANGQDVYFHVRARDVAGNLGDWSSPILVHFGVNVTVHVGDEGGVNVLGAKIYHNGKYVGTTDGSGNYTLIDTLLGDNLVATNLIYTNAAGKPDHTKNGTISWAWRVYLTSVKIANDGTPHLFQVSNTNTVQQLTVRRDQTLIGVHVIAVVQWDASQAFLDDLRQGMLNASSFLYDVTDGQFFFDTIEIFDNGVNGPANDYYFYTDNRVWPNAFIGAISRPVGRMMFPPQFGVSWADRGTYAVFVHEFGHYGLWLYDEYLQRDGSNGGFCTLNRGTNPADEPTRATIMDNQGNASELCSKADPNHLHNYNTQQDKENNGESDWETVLRMYKDPNNLGRWILQSPDTRHVAVVAGPTALPVADWGTVYLNNYDTGVCQPFDFQVNYLNGKPVVGAEVTIQALSGSIYNQGITDAKGNLMVRGAHNGDTLLVKKDNDSSSMIITCSPENLSQSTPTAPLSLIIQPDPFTLSVDYLPLSNSTLQIQVAASIALPNPPIARLWQEYAAQPLDVPLTYNPSTGTYNGVATLDPNLDLHGSTYVQATNTQQNTVFIQEPFSLQSINPDGTTKLTSSDGQMEIFLPAGSLGGNPIVSIQSTSNVGAPQGSLSMLGNAYSITTSNGDNLLQLPATLNINYSMGQLGAQQNEALGLYQWDATNQNWILISTSIDFVNHFISAHITQLGTYAVMAPPMYFISLPFVNK
jgi:hypothetical protein